jgi:hypothetical protein
MRPLLAQKAMLLCRPKAKNKQVQNITNGIRVGSRMAGRALISACQKKAVARLESLRICFDLYFSRRIVDFQILFIFNKFYFNSSKR